MCKSSQNELEVLLGVATEAVMTAGVILQDLWGKLEEIQEKGRPGDLLTEADKTAEAGRHPDRYRALWRDLCFLHVPVDAAHG